MKQINARVEENIRYTKLFSSTIQNSVEKKTKEELEIQKLVLQQINQQAVNIDILQGHTRDMRTLFMQMETMKYAAGRNPGQQNLNTVTSPVTKAPPLEPFSGIGTKLSKREDGLIIDVVFPDTPAEKAGLYTGDVIIKIDGQPVSELKASQATEKIRGTPGTPVVLTYIPSGAVGIVKEISIIRDTIDLKNKK